MALGREIRAPEGDKEGAFSNRSLLKNGDVWNSTYGLLGRKRGEVHIGPELLTHFHGCCISLQSTVNIVRHIPAIDLDCVLAMLCQLLTNHTGFFFVQVFFPDNLNFSFNALYSLISFVLSNCSHFGSTCLSSSLVTFNPLGQFPSKRWESKATNSYFMKWNNQTQEKKNLLKITKETAWLQHKINPY